MGLDGSGRGLKEVISRHLPRWTDESHEKPESGSHFLYTHKGSTRFLRNVSAYLPNYTQAHPRRKIYIFLTQQSRATSKRNTAAHVFPHSSCEQHFIRTIKAVYFHSVRVKLHEICSLASQDLNVQQALSPLQNRTIPSKPKPNPVHFYTSIHFNTVVHL
jgi:hypothetical protein